MKSLETLIAEIPNIKNIIFDVGGVLLRPTESSDDISFNPIEENVGTLKYLQKNIDCFVLQMRALSRLTVKLRNLIFLNSSKKLLYLINAALRKTLH